MRELRVQKNVYGSVCFFKEMHRNLSEISLVLNPTEEEMQLVNKHRDNTYRAGKVP